MDRRVVQLLAGSLLLVGLLLGVRATPAAACSCAMVSADAALARSGAVFAGTVTTIGEPSSGDSGSVVRLHVSVDRVYKGVVADRVVLSTAASSASCGLELPGPGRVVFFVPAAEVTTVAPIGSCDGPLPMLAGAPASFGAGTAPVPSAVDPGASPGDEPGSSSTGADSPPEWLWWLVGTTVAVGITGVVAVALRAARRRRLPHR